MPSSGPSPRSVVPASSSSLSSTWSKGRLIRLLIFVVIASILLPFFINDRMRGSQKQLVYYTNLGSQTKTPDATASADADLVVTPTIAKTTSQSQVNAQPQITTQPKTTTQPQITSQPKKVTPTRVPEFSDTDVLLALNNYRSTHQVHQLVEESHLCQYAESRVKDLVELGTLDSHAGFNADFADPLRLPQAIKDYPGSTIGEDLASQYCINMKTGQSFVATTPTALIEWCFDSSTKGHRESLLNNKFNNACVRHGQNMYVVILGD